MGWVCVKWVGRYGGWVGYRFALVKRRKQGKNEEVPGIPMDKESILLKLRQHAPELQEAGLVHLRVFGSVARGEANAHSDVDLLADFDRSKPCTLLTISRLENRLADILGAKVDLSSADWMKENIKKRIFQEAALVF